MVGKPALNVMLFYACRRRTMLISGFLLMASLEALFKSAAVVVAVVWGGELFFTDFQRAHEWSFMIEGKNS